jgi:hypothetical protein
MNSLPNRYTLANSPSTPYVVKVIIFLSTKKLIFYIFYSSQQTSSNDFETTKTSSSSHNKFPLPISELPSYDNNRASYDNILNYCLNPSNESNSIYAKFNFTNQEKQFEQRCANYDNLSYLVIDGISSKKLSKREIGKIASCKDYFAATTGFRFNENGQRE